MSYVKDGNGVIINTDDTQYRSIVALRESKRKNNQLEAKVATLENELSEIKNLITQLVHRNN